MKHAIAKAILADDSARRNLRSATSDDDSELDEVEIQKGFSQVAQGLNFLHQSVKMLHNNLTADSVVINAKGDWKLSGFGLATALFDDGIPARWTFPELDRAIPISLQRDYDYIGNVRPLEKNLINC